MTLEAWDLIRKMFRNSATDLYRGIPLPGRNRSIQIPIEIFQLIFALVVDSSGFRSETRWILSWVCREWRMISTGTPSLWSHISFDILPSSWDSTRSSEAQIRGLENYVKTCLVRSRTEPLSLFIGISPSWYDTSAHPALAALVAHSNRWKRLHFFAPLSGFEQFHKKDDLSVLDYLRSKPTPHFPDTELSLPLLEELQIKIRHNSRISHYATEEEERILESLRTKVFREMPQLRSIHICSELRGLGNLVENVPETVEEICFSHALTSLFFSTDGGHLKNFQRIKALHIEALKSECPWGPDVPKGYTLPDLECLKLGFDGKQQAAIEKIFEMVKLPSLNSLALYGPSTTFLQIVPHIFGNLRCLDIKRTTYQDGQFVLLMKQLPNLCELATSLPPWHELDAFARCENLEGFDQGVYLPNLEHLRLYCRKSRNRLRYMTYIDTFHSIAESRCEMPPNGAGLSRFKRLKSFTLDVPDSQTRMMVQFELDERASPGHTSQALFDSAKTLMEGELMMLLRGRMQTEDKEVWKQRKILDKVDIWFTKKEKEFEKIKDIREINLSELHHALYAFQLLPLREIEYPPKRKAVKKLRLQDRARVLLDKWDDMLLGVLPTLHWFRCPANSAKAGRLEYVPNDSNIRREPSQKEKLRSKMYGFIDHALEQGSDLDGFLYTSPGRT
ncbi:hypothetical protein NLJ89_g5719 [Agrocybe chaxingu]|uniref:F-box domain-containing protein n=1 Tax=Agrocybe chaxingu TaxID=84603 RepID=A0A9W8MUR8_9AGAR|nr:hypothetical protein NLJ89_g5719 [Agrocybe chaxingu]